MSKTETLISTLIQNGLASSRSEAQRMAESMISTSDKVNQGMRDTKDNYMVSNFKQKQTEQSNEATTKVETPQEPITGTPQEQKVEEMRRNALNPQPVNVQTEFDTPGNDQKVDFAAEPAQAEPAAEPLMAEPVAEAPAEPQMTPEEYAAQQMNDMGANTVSDLTSEAPQVEVSTSALEAGLPEPVVAEPITQAPAEPAPQPETTPGDFISQAPSEPAAQPMESLESTPFPTPNDEIASAPEEAEPAPEPQAVPTAEPKKKASFTPEEQKLADDVDLSKVFNFSNR